MANDKSSIEWCDATWNPTTGCSKVSEGCRHCYAERVSHRFGHTSKPWTHPYAAENIRLHPERLAQPLRWKQPRRVFVDSMSDLFHERVPDDFIASVFAVMAGADQHTFQVLTKRPERMARLLADEAFRREVERSGDEMVRFGFGVTLPLPNVWLGTSVEDQRAADARIPWLAATPAAVRFLSCEPLLGPLDLRPWLVCEHDCSSGTDAPDVFACDVCGARVRMVRDPAGPISVGDLIAGERYRARYELVRPGQTIDWVIAGGESGPGCRPLDPAWAVDLREQCAAAGIPFFMKQMGSVWARDHGGDAKGGDPDLWPAALRVRQMPAAMASLPATRAEAIARLRDRLARRDAQLRLELTP